MKAILDAPAPNNAKALSVPGTDLVAQPDDRVPFQWVELEEKAYQALKVMISQALVVQPLDWTNSFHVFVDVSDIAIRSVLM